MENLPGLFTASLKRKSDRPPLSDLSKQRKLSIPAWPATLSPCTANQTDRLPAIFDHSGPALVVRSSLPETPLLCSARNPTELLRKPQEMTALQGQISALEDHISLLTHTLHQAASYRDQLHRCIQALKGPIKVVCRIRPSNTEETLFLRYPERSLGQGAVLHTVEMETGRGVQSLTCDRVFDENSSQMEVFEALKGDFGTVFQGKMVTLLAYGAAGSGKVYTLEGSRLSSGLTVASGLLPRIAYALFESQNAAFQVHIACISLSSDSVTDLLSPSLPFLSVSQAITEESSWKCAFSPAHFLSLYETATSRRKSRSSHYITQIKVTGSDFQGQSLEGRLTIVELAGFEAKVETLAGSKSLNVGFYCLRKVLGMKIRAGKGVVPYRESKLTRLLQPWLATGLAILLLTLSAEAGKAEEARHTLDYAIEIQTPLA